MCLFLIIKCSIKVSNTYKVTYQESRELCATFLGRLVQRREAPLVGSVDNGVELNEQRCDVQVAVRAGVVQGDESALVLRVHVRPSLQQQLCDLYIVVAGCEHVQVMQNLKTIKPFSR